MTAPCPLCKKPADQAHLPFCSKRCADIDLGRWLKGVYVLPGAASGPDDEDAQTDSAPDDAIDSETP